MKPLSVEDGQLERLRKKLDKYQVVLGFCIHGKALAMCYDMPGMKADLKAIYDSYVRVERMSPEDSRVRFDGMCKECEAPR